MDPDVTAGALLRQGRARRAWSQAELARRAGMPASQLCAYETGAKQPSAATLARLVALTGARLALADPHAERLRQAVELADVLSLVDAMPPATARPPAPTFAQLTAS